MSDHKGVLSAMDQVEFLMARERMLSRSLFDQTKSLEKERDALKAENERLRKALTLIADGTTPWMDAETTTTEVWKVLANYARLALAAKEE